MEKCHSIYNYLQFVEDSFNAVYTVTFHVNMNNASLLQTSLL